VLDFFVFFLVELIDGTPVLAQTFPLTDTVKRVIFKPSLYATCLPPPPPFPSPKKPLPVSSRLAPQKFYLSFLCSRIRRQITFEIWKNKSQLTFPSFKFSAASKHLLSIPWPEWVELLPQSGYQGCFSSRSGRRGQSAEPSSWSPVAGASVLLPFSHH